MLYSRSFPLIVLFAAFAVIAIAPTAEAQTSLIADIQASFYDERAQLVALLAR